MNIWAWLIIAYFALNLVAGAAITGRAKKAAPAPGAGEHAGRVVVYFLMYAGLTLILLGAVGVL